MAIELMEIVDPVEIAYHEHFSADQYAQLKCGFQPTGTDDR